MFNNYLVIVIIYAKGVNKGLQTKQLLLFTSSCEQLHTELCRKYRILHLNLFKRLKT